MNKLADILSDIVLILVALFFYGVVLWELGRSINW